MSELKQYGVQQLTELYALVMLLSGAGDPALIRCLGLDYDALERQLAARTETAEAARLIVVAGHTGHRRLLALLIRGALVDQLAAVEKAAELRDLATAASRAPEWVFEEIDLIPENRELLAPAASRESVGHAIQTAAAGAGPGRPAPQPPYAPDLEDARDAPDPDDALHAPDAEWGDGCGEPAGDALACRDGPGESG